MNPTKKCFCISLSFGLILVCLADRTFASSIIGWGRSAIDSSQFPVKNPVAISAGLLHSLALRSDGSIVGWGCNAGYYTWLGQATPPDGNDFVAIAAGWGEYSLALRSDGAIVGWGYNYDGEASPPAGNDFIGIAAGWSHWLALCSDGSIVGWGNNDDGQATPPDGNDFVAIAAGDYHSLALRSDGSIVGWGGNWYGQATPPDGNNFVAIAAGLEYSLALCSDGSIVGWGENWAGQATPPDGNDFVAIAAGGYHALALCADGSIVGWGDNSDDGPATPPEGNNYMAIVAGGLHSLALCSDGSIVGWGDNWYGQASPPAGNNFVAIAAAPYYALALRSDGSIVGWGRNQVGQATPPDGNDFVAIAAGGTHSLALRSNGAIVGWGYNSDFQASPPAGNDFIGIAAGSVHSLALRSDGTIVGWGWNAYGQATPPAENDFVAIAAGGRCSLALRSDGSILSWGRIWSTPDGNDFVAIAAGTDHLLALRSDGSIVGWGDNSNGEATPPPENDCIAIAAGTDYSLALRSDGTIVGWGYNAYGQATPPAENDFVGIAAGDEWSLALRVGLLPTAFRILDSRPPCAGNVGPVLFEVTGSGFKPGVEFRLVQGAIQLEPNEVTFCSIFKLTGILDLTAAPLGIYDVVVANPDGQSVTLSQVFEVVEGGQPRFYAKLTVPSAVRPERSYTAYVEYGNEGEVAGPIPILHLSNSREAPMQIGSYGRQSPLGLALLGLGPEGFRTTLLPGFNTFIPITFTAPQTGSVQFDLTGYLPDENPFPWDDLEAIVRPAHLTDEAWDPEWSRLVGNMGSTWQEVVTQLGVALEDLPTVDVELSADLVAQMTFALWAYDQPPEKQISAHFDPVDDVQIIADRYDPSNSCTHIITHGMNSSANADNIGDLGRTLAWYCPSCNVLRVDWEEGARTARWNPWGAARNIDLAGEEAFQKIIARYDINWDSVTFIGHSFGNSVNQVISSLAGRRGKAIVLDPANNMGGSNPDFADFYGGGSVAIITDSLLDNGPCMPSPRRVADKQLHLTSYSHGDALRCFTEQIDVSNRDCSNPWLTSTLFQSVEAWPPGWYDAEISCYGTIIRLAFPECPEPHDLPVPSVPGEPNDSAGSDVVVPSDPSEKRGTEGYDPCGTSPELCRHFVPPNTRLEYTIFFENEPNATAPAQEVRIVDRLNLSLDWTSLELGEIVFGDQVVAALAGKVSGQDSVPLADSNYVVDIAVDFSPYTGCITWLLRTIDPVTSDLPEDPYAGLLPPNDANHCGEGHVTFTIFPQKDLPDARIPNKATIIFDTEPPFDVNVWLNTVDGSPPTSAVSALPAVSVPSLFEVQWSGTDGQGCGVAAYDVYVAPNEDPYAPWILNTHSTSAVFSGAPGYTYRFYSVARDFLGNVEPSPGSPATETAVGPIDFRFYGWLASRWLMDDCGPPLWCDGMDIDGNHVVDLKDVAIFAGNWLSGTNP